MRVKRLWSIFCLISIFLMIPGHARLVAAQPETWIEPVTGMEFVWIEGGCFDMGCDAGNECLDREKPVHQVCVDGFWMGKTEVTNAQYKAMEPKHNSRQYNGFPLTDDQLPVSFVVWANAKTFTDWLTAQQPAQSSVAKGDWMFRLPTEAEWEYAARAGTTTLRFWGDNPDDACQYANVADLTAQQAHTNFLNMIHNCDDGYAVSAPVASFEPNAFGLYDMIGNVWEWCEDVYKADLYSQRQAAVPVKNPLFTHSGGAAHVLRGGSWGYYPMRVHSAARIGGPIIEQDYNRGFRVVRVP